jgi:Protein of unknown function (DUF2628)
METHLYTVHRKGERGLRVVGDRFSFLALLFLPGWLVWERLWVTALGVLSLLAIAALVTPLAVSPVLYGAGAIAAFEGASLIRAELSLRGWREVAAVEARTEAGAEELYLTGRVA